MRLRTFHISLALALGATTVGCAQGEAPPAMGTGPTQSAPAQPTSARDSNEGNLLLGNPTSAAKDPDNYLLKRPQYTMSYNRARGGPQLGGVAHRYAGFGQRRSG